MGKGWFSTSSLSSFSPPQSTTAIQSQLGACLPWLRVTHLLSSSYFDLQREMGRNKRACFRGTHPLLSPREPSQGRVLSPFPLQPFPSTSATSTPSSHSKFSFPTSTSTLGRWQDQAAHTHRMSPSCASCFSATCRSFCGSPSRSRRSFSPYRLPRPMVRFVLWAHEGQCREA